MAFSQQTDVFPHIWTQYDLMSIYVYVFVRQQLSESFFCVKCGFYQMLLVMWFCCTALPSFSRSYKEVAHVELVKLKEDY